MPLRTYSSPARTAAIAATTRAVIDRQFGELHRRPPACYGAFARSAGFVQYVCAVFDVCSLFARGRFGSTTLVAPPGNSRSVVARFHLRISVGVMFSMWGCVA